MSVCLSVCLYVCMYVFTYLHMYLNISIYIYIHRVKVEGSPEANCIFLYGYGRCCFLHCILQCFMLFSEIVRSAQVAFSARINLTFVRAEK